MNKAERRMLFSTCVFNEGEVYAFTDFGGIPIKIDLEHEKILYINEVKNYQPFTVNRMLGNRGCVFALELNGKRMMQYNIKRNECFYYNIDCDKKDWGNYAAFAIYRENIYIFPTYADEIVKINLHLGSMQTDSRLYTKINKDLDHKNQKEDFTYFYCGCQLENIVWLFRRQGSFVVAYDMETDTWKEFKLSIEIDNCEHVIQYMDKLYILCSEGKIYSWDMMGELVDEVVDYSSENIRNTSFSRIIATDKKLFLLPALGEDIFYIDLNTKQIEKYEDYPEGFQYCAPKEWTKYHGYCEDREYYYFAMRSTNFMLSLNKGTGKAKWIKFKLPSYEDYMRMYIKYHKSLLSEIECTMEDVLDYSEAYFTEGNEDVTISLGEQAWRQMKS